MRRKYRPMPQREWKVKSKTCLDCGKPLSPSRFDLGLCFPCRSKRCHERWERERAERTCANVKCGEQNGLVPTRTFGYYEMLCLKHAAEWGPGARRGVYPWID